MNRHLNSSYSIPTTTISGADILRIRKQLSLTQAQLAMFANYESTKPIHRMENGKQEASGPIVPLLRMLEAMGSENARLYVNARLTNRNS